MHGRHIVWQNSLQRALPKVGQPGQKKCGGLNCAQLRKLRAHSLREASKSKGKVFQPPIVDTPAVL